MDSQEAVLLLNLLGTPLWKGEGHTANIYPKCNDPVREVALSPFTGREPT